MITIYSNDEYIVDSKNQSALPGRSVKMCRWSVASISPGVNDANTSRYG